MVESPPKPNKAVYSNIFIVNANKIYLAIDGVKSKFNEENKNKLSRSAETYCGYNSSQEIINNEISLKLSGFQRKGLRLEETYFSYR